MKKLFLNLMTIVTLTQSVNMFTAAQPEGLERAKNGLKGAFVDLPVGLAQATRNGTIITGQAIAATATNNPKITFALKYGSYGIATHALSRRLSGLPVIPSAISNPSKTISELIVKATPSITGLTKFTMLASGITAISAGISYMATAQTNAKANDNKRTKANKWLARNASEIGVGASALCALMYILNRK